MISFHVFKGVFVVAFQWSLLVFAFTDVVDVVAAAAAAAAAVMAQARVRRDHGLTTIVITTTIETDQLLHDV